MNIGFGYSLYQPTRSRQWWQDTALLSFDFIENRYVITTPKAQNQAITVTRASTGFAPDAAGQLIPFAVNKPRITNQGLLVEPSATNLNKYSANDPNWNGYGTTQPSISQDVMFDQIRGVSATFDENSDTGYSGSRACHSAGVFSVAGDTSYTASYILKTSRKLIDGEEIQIYITGGYGGWGKIITAVDDFTSPKHVEVSHLKASSTISSGYFVAYAKTSLQSPVTVFIGNRQFETGLKATSLIQTTGSSATRSADIVRADNIATTVSNLSRGIIVLDIDIRGDGEHLGRLFALKNENGVGRLLLMRSGSDLIFYFDHAGGAVVLTLGPATSGRTKAVIGFTAGGDVLAQLSGQELQSVTGQSIAIPEFSKCNIGSSEIGAVIFGTQYRAVTILDEEPTAARLLELSIL